MTPEALAALHARCFEPPLRWSATSFAELLRSPDVALLVAPGGAGFALARIVADEAELLTLATDPTQRRRGVARRLLERFAALARERGVRVMHLEVAADNDAARGLYAVCGYAEVGRRSGYYRDQAGRSVPAVLLSRFLPVA
jgi:[ribosomal protein S18]-alanine N-acetyltransferase